MLAESRLLFAERRSLVGCEALRAGTPAVRDISLSRGRCVMLANTSAQLRVRVELTGLDEDYGRDAGRAERIPQGNPRSGEGCLFSFRSVAIAPEW